MLSLPPVLAALPRNVKALAMRRVCRDLRDALAAPDAGLVQAAQFVPLWALQERWEALSAPQREQLARTAGRCGDGEAVQWLAGRGLWTQSGIAAAEAGHVEVLRRQAQPADDVGFCMAAARGGHVAVLRWLREQPSGPCPWDEWACVAAAAEGHIAVLECLRGPWPDAQPCPWCERVCATAACYGRIDVLRWLRAQHPPCPWSSWSCASAAAAGHIDVLRWLRGQPDPCPRTCAPLRRGAAASTRCSVCGHKTHRAPGMLG